LPWACYHQRGRRSTTEEFPLEAAVGLVQEHASVPYQVAVSGKSFPRFALHDFCQVNSVSAALAAVAALADVAPLAVVAALASSVAPAASAAVAISVAPAASAALAVSAFPSVFAPPGAFDALPIVSALAPA